MGYRGASPGAAVSLFFLMSTIKVNGHKKFIAPLRKAYEQAVKDALEEGWPDHVVADATKGKIHPDEENADALHDVRAAYLEWHEAEKEELLQRIREGK